MENMKPSLKDQDLPDWKRNAVGYTFEYKCVIGSYITDDEGGEKRTVSSDIISLQGYTDSNEAKATKEWQNFLDNYDQDHALLNKVSNSSTRLDEKYNAYPVYTQDMANELDKIANKYGLKLHKPLETFYNSNKELFELVGTGDFLGNVNKVESGYIYDDGTFRYDGYANLTNGKMIGYQFGNVKKGVFDDVILTVGNAKKYEERLYKTVSGASVYIVISKIKCLLITDLDKSFVTINVLPEFSKGEIAISDLKELADSINFSMIR